MKLDKAMTKLVVLAVKLVLTVMRSLVKKKVKKKTSKDEKDKEYLVEMLYSLISDNTQPANKSSRESGASPKSGDEDLPKPVVANREPEKAQFSVLVTPGLLEDLLSKSAFDNLLRASSDVTVEALHWKTP